jgi:hypothetical protein
MTLATSDRETLMRDVTCTRGADGTVTCSIPQTHKHHSPTGFEIGYGGSGPAYLALNILAEAIGPAPDPGPEPDEASSPDAWEAWAQLDGQRVKLWDGSYVRRRRHRGGHPEGHRGAPIDARRAARS